jgi:amidophosphoribosyltransferase
MFDLKEKCGIFGVFGHPEAANLTYLGLYALQHRGQESAGIASLNKGQILSYKHMGLVADIFSEEVLKNLPGNAAIGHVRYSTTGLSLLKNAQPFVVDYSLGSIAVAHNGNLINAEIVRDELEAHGSIFQSTMDTEIIVHLISLSKKGNFLDRLIEALSFVRGAYSLLFLTKKKMVAVRDPNGIRPLVLGKIKGKELWVVSSESCALDLIDAELIREVAPGEIIVIDNDGFKSYKPFEKKREAFCIFEYIYFARPDSIMQDRNVYEVRKMLGRQLAIEKPVDADYVIPVPDSGIPAAIGYSQQIGIPFELGIIRNHYVGRTFIEPRQSIRGFGVKVKLNSLKKVIEGKKIILVDDSIVRATTSKKIVNMIRNAGAKEVHMRISSPPTTHPCFYGIDTPKKLELIASTHTLEEINKRITSDSLGYLSSEGMRESVNKISRKKKNRYCDACFTGNYPIGYPKFSKEDQLKLFKNENEVNEE